jgi:putative DNA primase/helicase
VSAASLDGLAALGLSCKPNADGSWSATCPGCSVPEALWISPAGELWCQRGCEPEQIHKALSGALDSTQNGDGPHEPDAKRSGEERGAEPQFHLTDVGNAERLVAAHGSEIRFVPGLGWHIWDGQRWLSDDIGAVMRLAKETARSIYAEAASCEDDNERQRIAAWAARSAAEPRLRAMLSLAESELPVVVRARELDANPWLLTALNGTVDLRTGRLRAHNPDDLTTKLAPVKYEPDARSDLWDKFIATTTGGNDAGTGTGASADLAGFIQRIAGYTLSGSTSEEILLFIHGPGASGKSTFLEALKATLGDYAAVADFETFLKKRGDAGVRNDIARLAGARMVSSIEVDDGKALAEGLIKTLVGGDTVAARHLYREHFEFLPRFKLWLVANHRPSVRHDDDAMWRRIVAVPFTHVVAEAERDLTLKARFRDDPDIRAAVLAWAVRGCLAWQESGLGIPRVVSDYTDEYRAENDPLAEWIADECELGSGSTSARSLRERYQRWCDENSVKAIGGGKEWGDALRTHGCERTRSGHGGEKRWRGIQLRVTG